ncbi:MAG: diguanylate cyclase [Rhodocyclaceae bacterium]|nr:diguanylate cyclase [Rhodocyclaceae bacterium]
MFQLTDRDGHPPMDIMRVLNDLDTGIIHHLAWFKQVHRTLVCDQPALPADLADDAHRHCNFGRWYHQADGHPEFVKISVFGTIGELHQGMHRLARDLLQRKTDRLALPCGDYDRFMERAIAFKLAIRNLQYQIVKSVCVVDPLTGAWNRHGMYARLGEEQERMIRSGDPCCLCMLDLDHFKDVNDKHGHAAGDDVLKATVQLVTGVLRKYDSIFRYGGEEFLVCMPRTPLDQAEIILDRLRIRLAETPFVLKGGQKVSLTASFGVAPMLLGVDIQETLESADYALLCAKSGGRNRVCVWGR